MRRASVDERRRREGRRRIASNRIGFVPFIFRAIGGAAERGVRRVAVPLSALSTPLRALQAGEGRRAALERRPTLQMCHDDRHRPPTPRVPIDAARTADHRAIDPEDDPQPPPAATPL